jgi:predicted enzyme related to lactoylglutathione lyase
MSGRVMHFELPTDDLARAGKFYEEIFGWSVTPQGETAAMVATTPSDENGQPTEPGGINGGLAARGGAITTALVTVHVNDIDDSLRQVEQAGGKLVQEKAPVGDFGFVAYISDTEGNTVGLWQFA